MPPTVPLVVRELVPSGYEVFSEHCQKVAYTSVLGDLQPEESPHGDVWVIRKDGSFLEFLPDDEYTDCSKYDVIPVSVIDNIDGTFDVYSNVCGFNIFESQQKIGQQDNYRWETFELYLIVET